MPWLYFGADSYFQTNEFSYYLAIYFWAFTAWNQLKFTMQARGEFIGGKCLINLIKLIRITGLVVLLILVALEFKNARPGYEFGWSITFFVICAIFSACLACILCLFCLHSIGKLMRQKRLEIEQQQTRNQSRKNK